MHVYVYFQTYVNGSRIPADIPVTLNIKDTVKFGRDILLIVNNVTNDTL